MACSGSRRLCEAENGLAWQDTRLLPPARRLSIVKLNLPAPIELSLECQCRGRACVFIQYLHES